MVMICLQKRQLESLTQWYHTINTALAIASRNLQSALSKDPMFETRLRAAVYELNWALESHILAVDASIEQSRRHLVAVLNAHVSEVIR